MTFSTPAPAAPRHIRREPQGTALPPSEKRIRFVRAEELSVAVTLRRAQSVTLMLPR